MKQPGGGKRGGRERKPTQSERESAHTRPRKGAPGQPKPKAPGSYNPRRVRSPGKGPYADRDPRADMARNDRSDGARSDGTRSEGNRLRGKSVEAKPKAPEARPKHAVLKPMTREVIVPKLAPARVGEWLYTTRPEAERDLLDEIILGMPEDDNAFPRPAGPALVAVPENKRPRVELAFARQGFPVAAIVAADDPAAHVKLAAALVHALPIAQGRAARARGPQPFALDGWVPDDDRTNPHSAAMDLITERTRAVFPSQGSPWSAFLVGDARAAWAENGLYAQMCLEGGKVYMGVTNAREAPSLASGGRLRVHLPAHVPSRSAAKLLEAFIWLDRAPEAGEMCVDLGAAPGGWSWVLLERRAHVLAIDPGRLDPLLAKKRGLTHLRADAFKYEPEDTVDWLVADMAWRPLEAAALYGKWARRGWARLLIANIKLPMIKKAEYLLRVKDILTQSGWQNLRARQLYHDREEVTVAGVRL